MISDELIAIRKLAVTGTVDGHRYPGGSLRALQQLLEERDEYDALFALQHIRTREADKAWQRATGRIGVMPDLGTLLEWLLDRSWRLEELDK